MIHGKQFTCSHLVVNGHLAEQTNMDAELCCDECYDCASDGNVKCQSRKQDPVIVARYSLGIPKDTGMINFNLDLIHIADKRFSQSIIVIHAQVNAVYGRRDSFVHFPCSGIKRRMCLLLM
ncbi:rh183 [macacine betaherpesvirus 3]|uniref:Rh183 n=1 Tax=Rhesus cytomegalovirus (strain 68-1) TaxID=47929 RepID=Q2FAB5_RHCM6|nr:rh183 [macacine betaherpesvirus 3]